MIAIAPVAAVGLVLLGVVGVALLSKSSSTPAPTSGSPTVTPPPESTPKKKATAPAAEPESDVPAEAIDLDDAPPAGEFSSDDSPDMGAQEWLIFAWYSYVRGGTKYWIRVDLGPYDRQGLQFRCNNDKTWSDAPKSCGGMYYMRSYRPWRWTVVAGESTPLATQLVQGPFEASALIAGALSLLELYNETSDIVARLASDWIDVVVPEVA